MRSPNVSARSPLTRDLSGLSFIELQIDIFHHVVVEVINLSRNVQVGCPLLELRGGHVVVLQVKIPQVALVRQLIDNVAESVTCSLSAQN